MIQSSPRPLPRRRLEQLITGLQIRTSRSAQQMSDELQSLQQQIAQLQAQHELDAENLSQAHQRRLESATTDWDEQTNSCWDTAELRAFKAVYETRQRERSIAASAKSDSEHISTEARSRVTEIEKRYQQSLEVNGHKFDQFRGTLDTIRRVIDKVRLDGETALAKHSLQVPAEYTKQPLETLRESHLAVDFAKAAVVAGQHTVKRLENLPLANLASSIWWWLFCLAVFAVAIAVPMLMDLGILVASITGVATLALVILTAMLGVRPWLKKSAAAEYPKLLSHLAHADGYVKAAHELSIAENDTEQKRLASKRDEKLNSVTGWHEAQIAEIRHKAEAAIATLRSKAFAEKTTAAKLLKSGLQELNQKFEAQLEQQSADFSRQRVQATDEMTNNRAAMLEQIDRLRRGGAHRLQISTQKAVQLIQRNNFFCQDFFPNWDLLGDSKFAWPEQEGTPRLPVGKVRLNHYINQNQPTVLELPELETDLLFSPLDDGYLVLHADPTHTVTKDFVRSLLLRALTTMPAGKTQLCVIDPPGLGRDFGWLMHLSDFDPNLVTHRVWTQPVHIARQVQNLAAHAEDFIQQSLRNQYGNIVDYNRDAGSLAEPFRLLVWSSLPSGMDDQSWKSLQSLLDTGARCGIIPILIIDPALSCPFEYEEVIARRGLHLSLDSAGKLAVRTSSIEGLSLEPETTASDSQADAIVSEVGRRTLLASRVEVPLANMVATSAAERWQGNSSRSLEIPIGQSGVGRVHSMKLGVGTAQHAIIAGKTGSGKSSLLHALITSAIMKYSPESLRLVLLDFKKGVEFQVYSDSAVPHADIIGIESHREFGLSALEYIDQCLQRRGEMFRKSGVQDIASWNAMNPDSTLPRMLMVVDEFQELFVEDDKLSQAASLILDRIVRQGRSFGVHAVLSSQTLAGSYSLPRTTLGQMAVRIALQCDPADAQIIFADDNPAATRLKHPGQAVYNDTGGRIEGNQPMQIGWLDKATQVKWFAELPQGYRNQDTSTNLLGHTVVYDGNRPATWQPAQAELAISRAQQHGNLEAVWCVAGESVSISPAVVFPVTNQAGRNMLLVGAEDAMAAAVMHVATVSFVRSVRAKGLQPAVVTIQGAKPTDAKALTLPQLWKTLPCSFTSFDIRGDKEGVAQVHQLLQARMADSAAQADPLLLNIVQLGRLRNLKRDEEFSFGQSEVSADKMLEEVLRDGPSHSIHVMIWAESYSTVNRWLSRSALREMEIRLLMQMSANDSSNLVDSVAASKLGEHVMLLYDEATGQEQKFRPYSMDSLQDLQNWVSP